MACIFIYMIRKCKHCNIEINDKDNYHNYRTHVSNCKLNPKTEQKRTKLIELNRNKKQKYKFNCLKCDKDFELELTEYKFKTGKHKKYCSITCANSRKWSEKDKLKKSISVTKSFKELGFCLKIEKTFVCNTCKKTFKKIVNPNKEITFCSRKCFRHSQETKNKMSEIKKKLYEEHPEKHPNKRCSNNESFPEKFVRVYLEERIGRDNFESQYKIGKYYVDFYFPSLNLGLEIDGEYWHDITDEKEIKREEYIRRHVELKRFWSKDVMSKKHHDDFEQIIREHLLVK